MQNLIWTWAGLINQLMSELVFSSSTDGLSSALLTNTTVIISISKSNDNRKQLWDDG